MLTNWRDVILFQKITESKLKATDFRQWEIKQTVEILNSFFLKRERAQTKPDI